MKFRLLFILFFSFSLFSFSQTISNFPYTESFESGLGDWTNATNDSYDWIRISGETSSAFTGPSSAYSGSYYLYVESSYPNYPSLPGHLISPVIDAGSQQFGALFFSFWYHLYGDTMGSLFVDISTDDGTTWTSLFSVSGDQGNAWHEKVLDLSVYTETPFRLRFRSVTGSNYHSDIGIDYFVFTAFHNNVGIVSVDNPVVPVSSGLNNVDITIKNLGTNTNISSDINWEVNGLAQPTFNYSGSLATASSYGPFTIGSYDFTPGTNNLKIWISNANNTTDIDNNNDTIEVSFCTALSAGTYTIGSGGDYLTFTDAADVLNNCGISGPVEFIVEPGVYNESFRLYEIPGASDVNTVTFDGVNADLVKITDDASIQPAVIELQGTDHLTIKNLSIENTGISNAWGIHMQQGADYNRIESNRIIVPNYNWIDNVCPVVASNSEYDDYGEGNNVNFCVISGNTLMGGEAGIHLEGIDDPGSLMKGIEILNNDISGTKNYGIFIDNPDSLTISGNNIHNMVNYDAVGMCLLDPVNFYLDGNNIISNYLGLYILNGNLTYTPAGTSNITNNMIYGKNNYAVYLEEIKETNIFHNTCAGFGGMNISGIVNDDIRNNIFTAENDYAFYSEDVLSGDIDYNLYYTPETNTNFIYEAGDHPDLATWQSANTNINVNSVEINPVFVSADDLHILSPFANDLGDNSVGITLDIDGDSRPASPSVTVDIGADEYKPDSVDVEMVNIFIDPAICGDSLTGVYAVIRNLGTDTLFTAPITVNVSNAINQTLNAVFNDTLTFGESDTIQMGTINTYAGGTFMLQGFTGVVNDMNLDNDTLLTGFSVNSLLLPEVTYTPFCPGESVCLLATCNSGVVWYDSISGGNIIGTGNTFCTASLNSDTVFYAGLAPVTDSLETTYSPSGECTNGNMFDITVDNNIKIDSLALNFAYPGAQTVELYYIANGSYVGNETDPGAWTSWTTINVNTAGGYTIIDPGTPLEINAGETYAIYIDYNAVYSAGDNIYSNQNVSISAGAGLDESFGSLNNSRTFNGTVFYSMDACNTDRVIVNTIPEPLTTAGFIYIADDLEVSIINTAEYAEFIEYNFGNGYTSYLSDPVITYDVEDTYEVCQVTYNYCGTDTSCTAITVCTLPDAGFTYTANELEVSFTSLAVLADSVVYDFGDGASTSSNTDAVHTYSDGGTYEVSQIAYNSCGTDTSYITISVCTLPDADFTYISNELEISFTSLATLADSVKYDFGDGASTSSDTDPVHTYSADGTYEVSQVAYNSCGTDTSYITISVCTLPDADFTYIADELEVTFTSLAILTDSVVYDFGDGASASSAANPVHTYSEGGTYEVSQIAYNSCGTDTSYITISVCTLPDSDFSYIINELEVTFTSLATLADSVKYDFGDGSSTSSDTDPVHTYSEDGIYEVSQVAYNSCGTDTSSIMFSVCTLPDADFDYTINAFEVSFANYAVNATFVEYDFGDGYVSYLPDPVYTYSETGTYDVCQYAYNNCGTDTLCLQIDIVVDFVQEFSGINNIEIYPNPAKDKINLTFDIESNEHVQINLLTLTGETVVTRNLESVRKEDKYEMDLNNVSPGIYMIEIRIGNSVKTHKLVVE